jgi:hypothetical protein
MREHLGFCEAFLCDAIGGTGKGRGLCGEMSSFGRDYTGLISTANTFINSVTYPDFSRFLRPTGDENCWSDIDETLARELHPLPPPPAPSPSRESHGTHESTPGAVAEPSIRF